MANAPKKATENTEEAMLNATAVLGLGAIAGGVMGYLFNHPCDGKTPLCGPAWGAAHCLHQFGCAFFWLELQVLPLRRRRRRCTQCRRLLPLSGVDISARRSQLLRRTAAGTRRRAAYQAATRPPGPSSP